MDIHAWLQQYGYAALIVGSFAEGDTFLLAGGFLAHQHHFFWGNIFTIGVLTAIAHGQLCFYLGRHYGQTLLQRLPTLQLRSQRILDLLQRKQRILIVFYRLIFGFRTVTPVLIGLSDVSASRFLFLNTLGALLWSACYTALGYLVGSAIELMVGRIKQDVLWILLVALGLIALWSMYHALVDRKRNDSSSNLKKD